MQENHSIVLLVEDNEDLNQINRRALQNEGYEVITALTLAEARLCLAQYEPDVILLDVLLPDGNGIDFCGEIRGYTDAHIIFLTSCLEDESKIRSFDTGGDDYLTKPYMLAEIRARVRSAIRRRNMEKSRHNIITKGRLRLDIVSRQATIDGVVLKLGEKEFRVLHLLLQSEGVAISAEQIYEMVWGQAMYSDKAAIKKVISRLRGKIKQADCAIISVYGTGEYIFECNA